MSGEPALLSAPLSVGSFIKFGWETFKKRPWFFIFAVILFSLIGGVVNGFGSLVQSMVDGTATTGIGHLLGFLINIAVNVMVGIGTLAFFIKAHDTPDTATYYDAWRPELFWKYLGAYILFVIIVSVGFILFIIPGIIASLTFGFTLYLVVDKGLGPIEALKESARLTKGNRWRMLAMAGASALLMILGILCLIVGIFVAAPILTLAGVEMYRRISAAADAQAHTPLTGGEKTLVGFGFLLPIVAVVGIIAAITLAALGTARLKGTAAFTELQLKELQLSVEMYYNAHASSYPASLSDISSQLPPGTNIDFTKFTYQTDAKHSTYKLCAVDTVPEGADQCVSSTDSTTTTQ